MTLKFLQTTAILLSLTVISAPAYSGDLEHRTVEKVIQAYGGAKFERLKSLTLTSDLRYGWLGQGYSSDYVDLDPMRKIHEFDFKKEFGSEEAWGGAGGYAERIFTTDKGQFTIDYNNKTYSHEPDTNLYGHFGSEIRGSDTLLAYDLMKHRNTAKYKGQKLFRGVNHDLIEYDMPGTSIDPELWINSETGHISKMRRDIPDIYPINYVFNDFTKARGITYAEVFELYIDTTLVEYTKSRTLMPNKIRRNTFTMDKGISAQPETFDTEKMSIDHVKGSLHHVGQGAGFSAFWDAGEYIIAVGAYGGFGDRFKGYQDAQGHKKPLKYLVLTHHHRDHLESVNDALELGAKLVATETARKNLNDVTKQELSDDQFMVLSEDKTNLGPIDIHRISTGHVGDFALVYFPGAKTAFDADHYSGSFKTRASAISPNAMSLISEIKRLGLDMEYLLTAHSPKIEDWKSVVDMSKKHVPGQCPTRRKICSDLQ